VIFIKYLFSSIPSEEISQLQINSIARYGRMNVQRAEVFINKLTKDFLSKLKNNHDSIIEQLFSLQNLPCDSEQIQTLIAQHYSSIKQYWGVIGTEQQHLESYSDLAENFKSNKQFSMINEGYYPQFGLFMNNAILHFVKKSSKKR
jgi:hypothetical protein